MEQIDRNTRIAYARACCEKNLYTTVKPEKPEKLEKTEKVLPVEDEKPNLDIPEEVVWWDRSCACGLRCILAMLLFVVLYCVKTYHFTEPYCSWEDIVGKLQSNAVALKIEEEVAACWTWLQTDFTIK